MERLTFPESVLEHTGMVAIVSMAIGTELLRIEPDCVKLGWILSRALVHDMDELITGDLPRPTKYSSPKATELFEELSRTGVDKVSRTMLKEWPGFAAILSDVHKVAKEGREGLVVKLADQLAVVYMVWREVLMRGNHTLIRQAFTVSRQLDKTRQLVKDNFIEGETTDFLYGLIYEAQTIAFKAQDKNDPIHGIMIEDT